MAYKYVAHIHQNKIQDHTLFISIPVQHHPLRKKNMPQSDGVFFISTNRKIGHRGVPKEGPDSLERGVVSRRANFYEI